MRSPMSVVLILLQKACVCLCVLLLFIVMCGCVTRPAVVPFGSEVDPSVAVPRLREVVRASCSQWQGPRAHLIGADETGWTDVESADGVYVQKNGMYHRMGPSPGQAIPESVFDVFIQRQEMVQDYSGKTPRGPPYLATVVIPGTLKHHQYQDIEQARVLISMVGFGCFGLINPFFGSWANVVMKDPTDNTNPLVPSGYGKQYSGYKYSNGVIKWHYFFPFWIFNPRAPLKYPQEVGRLFESMRIYATHASGQTNITAKTRSKTGDTEPNKALQSTRAP